MTTTESQPTPEPEAQRHSLPLDKPKGTRNASVAASVTASGRHGLRILFAAGCLALMAAGAVGYWYFYMRGKVFTDDARLAGHLVDLAPEISGRLVAVSVREGQFVHSGAEIFRLDTEPAQAALNQAQAYLASAKANVAVSQAKCEKTVNGNRPEEIAAAEATVKRLENEEDLARVLFDRAQKLKSKDIATQDDLDRARTVLESAKENRENAAQNRALLRQGSRAEDIAAAKADLALAQSRVAEAMAAVERAGKDLEHCTVKAPFDGWVVRRWLDPGAMPLPGQPIVSLFDPATLRVDANIEEKYLGRVEIGDQADIRVDAYPRLRLRGRVTEILRATNSQFSLIPAEGVSGTFIKVTQRVPLRIAVAVPPDVRLGPGLSVVARILVGSSGPARPAEERAAP